MRLRKVFFVPMLCISITVYAQNTSIRTKVITLGTRAGPTISKDRAQASNLLVVGESLYLIDAGAGVTRRILESGHQHSKISKIFITHLHDDHTAGLATLLDTAILTRRGQTTDIYGSGATSLLNGVKDFLKPNLEIREAQTGPSVKALENLKAHEIDEGTVYEDDKVKVTAVQNTHFNFAKNSPLNQKYKSYSYRFQTPDRIVVFSGDTGPSEALTLLASGADLLVTESHRPSDEMMAKYKESLKRDGVLTEREKSNMFHMVKEHISPEEVGIMAAKAKVKELVVTHIVLEVDDIVGQQRFIDDIRKNYKGPLTIAKDLSEF